MPKKAATPPPLPMTLAKVIPFRPFEDSGDTTDSRWREVEAMYLQLIELEPRFSDRIRQRLEQAISLALPDVIAALNAPERARLVTSARRFMIDHSEQVRRKAAERLTQGAQESWLDAMQRDRPNGSEQLEDLVIGLRREVDDLKRDRARAAQKGGAR